MTGVYYWVWGIVLYVRETVALTLRKVWSRKPVSPEVKGKTPDRCQ